MSDFLQLFGVLGVLVWFLYYTTKTVIPNIHKQNNELISKIIADHKEAQIAVTEKFDVNLREERDARRTEIREEREFRAAEIKEERTLRKQEMDEMMDAIRSVNRPHIETK